MTQSYEGAFTSVFAVKPLGGGFRSPPSPPPVACQQPDVEPSPLIADTFPGEAAAKGKTARNSSGRAPVAEDTESDEERESYGSYVATPVPASVSPCSSPAWSPMVPGRSFAGPEEEPTPTLGSAFPGADPDSDSDSNSESLQWPQWPQRSAPLDARDAEAAFSIRSYAEEVLDRCSSSPVQRHPNRPTSSFLEEMQRRGHGDSRSVSPVGMPAPRTPERGSIPPGSRPTIDSPQMIKIDGAIAVARSLLSPKGHSPLEETPLRDDFTFSQMPTGAPPSESTCTPPRSLTPPSDAKPPRSSPGGDTRSLSPVHLKAPRSPPCPSSGAPRRFAAEPEPESLAQVEAATPRIEAQKVVATPDRRTKECRSISPVSVSKPFRSLLAFGGGGSMRYSCGVGMARPASRERWAKPQPKVCAASPCQRDVSPAPVPRLSVRASPRIASCLAMGAGPEAEPSPLLAECVPVGAEDCDLEVEGFDDFEALMRSAYETALDRLNATLWAIEADTLQGRKFCSGFSEALKLRCEDLLSLTARLPTEVLERLQAGDGLERWPSDRQQELRERGLKQNLRIPSTTADLERMGAQGAGSVHDTIVFCMSRKLLR